MGSIPTPLIMLPLIVAMVTFFLRFYRLNPEENTRNPNFIAAAASLFLLLSYPIGVQVLIGGSPLLSVVYFVASVALCAAAIRAMFKMRGKVD